MISRLKAQGPEVLRLLHLSAKLLAGRRYWIAPLLPLLWIAFQYFRLWIGWQEVDYGPAHAQNVLIGFPLLLLGIGLGVRVIAGEMDLRTLEIAYTVPGGTHRVWLAKLAAAFLLLTASVILLAGATYLFCTDYPPGAIYGAMQSAVFYMVLAMAFSALFKGEAVGALVVCIVLILNFVFQAALPGASPFYNAETRFNMDEADVIAQAVRNRIGYLLMIATVTLLAFGRAESREKILGG